VRNLVEGDGGRVKARIVRGRRGKSRSLDLNADFRYLENLRFQRINEEQ
jgi:hypothetical protein